MSALSLNSGARGLPFREVMAQGNQAKTTAATLVETPLMVVGKPGAYDEAVTSG